mmetsp:Transcript_61075/g.167535  ORF Transcript_61075/g.167535 Transcript_61075/m.167535 type:complete len:263 (+) Transcript_61075:1755-2543(+)
MRSRALSDLSESSKLAGLISRWMMPFACKYSRPLSSSNTRRFCSSGRKPARRARIQSKSSPPEHSSCTNRSSRLCLSSCAQKASKTLTTLTWLRARITSSSSSTSSASSSSAITLTATAFLSDFRRPLYTLLNFPFPSLSPSSYVVSNALAPGIWRGTSARTGSSFQLSSTESSVAPRSRGRRSDTRSTAESAASVMLSLLLSLRFDIRIQSSSPSFMEAAALRRLAHTAERRCRVCGLAIRERQRSWPSAELSSRGNRQRE